MAESSEICLTNNGVSVSTLLEATAEKTYVEKKSRYEMRAKLPAHVEREIIRMQLKCCM